MAFVNARLTDEQREEFERKCIGDPLSPALPVLKPLEWICDNEKESYLFSIGTHHDYPNEELFFWHWKNQEFILPVKKKIFFPIQEYGVWIHLGRIQLFSCKIVLKLK
jgi:hypothetical protein